MFGWSLALVGLLRHGVFILGQSVRVSRCVLLQGQVAHGGTSGLQPLMSSSPRARRARSLLLCVLSALLARSQMVAVVTSSNCVRRVLGVGVRRVVGRRVWYGRGLKPIAEPLF